MHVTKSTREKLLAVGAIGAFALVWAVLVIPALMVSAWFAAMAPPFQYVLYNVGFYLFTVVVVYLPYWYLRGKRVKWEKVLIAGLATWILFSFVIDMWEPPQFLGWNGAILITNETSLPGTAVDAMTAWCWNALGVPYSNALYICTYVITPIITIIIAVLIFKANSVWKGLGV
jgi:hypothetical protein